jgi:hypothetical protein
MHVAVLVNNCTANKQVRVVGGTIAKTPAKRCEVWLLKAAPNC